MEIVVIILAVGQTLTAGLVFYLLVQQGRQKDAIAHLLTSVKSLTTAAIKSAEIFKLVSKWITEKGK